MILQYLLSVQIVKFGRCIFASGVKEDGRPAWVLVDEVGEALDFADDNTIGSLPYYFC